MAAILNFRVFAKNLKTQICFFFQKLFLSLKMTAILNFQIFAENGEKKQIGLYLFNWPLLVAILNFCMKHKNTYLGNSAR